MRTLALLVALTAIASSVRGGGSYLMLIQWVDGGNPAFAYHDGGCFVEAADGGYIQEKSKLCRALVPIWIEQGKFLRGTLERSEE